MNQHDIDKLLDDMITKAESELDQMFARRLRELLLQLSDMFRKYSVNGKDPSFNELNKYNRLQKELALITEMIALDYRQVLKDIQGLMETQYIENYLRSAYVYEFEAQEVMGFGMPSLTVVREAITNPIEFLTLPKLLEGHRNDLIRRIRIDISQGLLAGEGYADMANRIEESVKFSSKKAQRVARTEGHRAQVLGRMVIAKEASKHAEMKKMWDGTLDSRTRVAHRKLDGTVVGFDEVFRSIAGGLGIAPGLMFNAADDVNCRCSVVFLVNGKLPEVRRARNEEDPKYQQKLANRIEKYMLDGLTAKQAERKAKREIRPPSLVVPYQTYDQWFSNLKAS